MIPRRRPRLSALAALVAHLACLTAPAFANPEGGSVLAGEATITQSPGLTHVTQSSGQAAKAKQEVAGQAAEAKGQVAKMEKPAGREGEKKEDQPKSALPAGAIDGKESVVPEGGLVTMADSMMAASMDGGEDSMMDSSSATQRMRRMALAPVTEIKAPQLRPAMSAGLAGAIGRGSTRSASRTFGGSSRTAPGLR